MPRRALIALLGLTGLVLGAVALRLLVGGAGLGWPESAEVWNLRLLRVGLGGVVGASLAVAGVLMQSLLRNPLASPDILGPASGASLAVILAAYLGGASAGVGALGALTWQGGPAVLGACAALAVVYALSQRRGVVDPVQLVLVGVVISIMCGAGVMLVQHLMPDAGYGALRLLVGALNDDTGTPLLLTCGAIALSVIALSALRARALDAAVLDDDEARSVGLRLGPVRAAAFLGAGVLTAVGVVLAGPIGFVGLICPHIVRLLLGPRGGGSAGLHRPLVIGSALAGGALIIAGDAAIKAIDLGSGRLPLGVLTAILGGPVLIVLLRRRGA